MGIFGKKPGSDTDEESYRPNRDKEKSEKDRMRELGQTQVSSPVQTNPGKATVPTMPPQRPLPAMPSVTTATAHEINSTQREGTKPPSDTYTFPPRESLMYTPRESFTVPPRETGNESRPQEKKSMSYSIDDVIRLMRELPDSKKEMVVIIVQKTLLSAKIDITNILDDASKKTEKLQKQSEKMVTEIRDLEEAIILKKGEVDGINREIEEINGVKSLFETVYSRHLREESENKDKVTAPPVPGTGNAGGY